MDIPALVSATLQEIPDRSAPYPVAISIDGVVRAVSSTIHAVDVGGKPIFEEPRLLAMLPESVLTPGHREFELWLIGEEPGDGSLRLRPIPIVD